MHDDLYLSEDDEEILPSQRKNQFLGHDLELEENCLSDIYNYKEQIINSSNLLIKLLATKDDFDHKEDYIERHASPPNSQHEFLKEDLQVMNNVDKFGGCPQLQDTVLYDDLYLSEDDEEEKSDP